MKDFTMKKSSPMFLVLAVAAAAFFGGIGFGLGMSLGRDKAPSAAVPDEATTNTAASSPSGATAAGGAVAAADDTAAPSVTTGIVVTASASSVTVDVQDRAAATGTRRVTLKLATGARVIARVPGAPDISSDGPTEAPAPTDGQTPPPPPPLENPYAEKTITLAQLATNDVIEFTYDGTTLGNDVEVTKVVWIAKLVRIEGGTTMMEVNDRF